MVHSLSHNTQIFEKHANIGAVLETTVQLKYHSTPYIVIFSLISSPYS